MCVKKEQRIYLQVAYLLVDEETVEREFRSLKVIDDQYPKYVVSMDAIGSFVSTKKISDTMTSSRRKIAPQTIESYIQGLLESYVFRRTKRYDVKGKQHLKTLEKYYVTDLGLRFHLLGNPCETKAL